MVTVYYVEGPVNFKSILKKTNVRCPWLGSIAFSFSLHDLRYSVECLNFLVDNLEQSPVVTDPFGVLRVIVLGR